MGTFPSYSRGERIADNCIHGIGVIAGLIGAVAIVAAAARQAGAAAHGPVAQGAWLDRLGIAGRGAALKASASPRRAADIDAALARLTAPEAMGTLFKIMAIADRRLGVPPGSRASQPPHAGPRPGRVRR